MFKRLCACLFSLAVASAAAQLSSALPADRLALANQLAKRGLVKEALVEYEAIRHAKDVPQDEILYRLGMAYRRLTPPKTADAAAAFTALIKDHPASRYVDYARLERASLQADARRRTTDLLALDRAEVPGSVRATALYRLGEFSEKDGDTDAAVNFYQRAARVSPTNDLATYAHLRTAALLAASPAVVNHTWAQRIYADLAKGGDTALVEQAVFFSAMLNYRDGHYAEAVAGFRRLADDFADGAYTAESRVYACWANFLSRQYGEALRLASELKAQGNEDAAYLTAASLRALERQSDARSAYGDYLRQYPNGRHAAAARHERLLVLSALGDSAAVLDELARHPPALTDKAADRILNLGYEAAVAVTNYPQAIQYAALIAKMTNSPYAMNATQRLAWLKEQEGQWKSAAALHRHLVAHWPDSPSAAQSLYQAGMDEIKRGRSDLARNDWTELLARYPDSPLAADALYVRAMEEIRAKEYRTAERTLAERARRFPQAGRVAEASYWWGVAAKGIDDDPEAERHFRDALAARPTAEFDREIRLELAAVLQRRGRTAESAQMFAGLLETKAVDRLPPETLAWVAESLLETTNGALAAAAAKVIESRNVSPAWNQTGATLAGEAAESLGETDAAAAAYARALKTGVRTVAGTKAALALGKIESQKGLFDEAKAHLADAVERAKSTEQLAYRAQAYAALARNEEERGDSAAALGYHLLVGTLFDDADIVPRALARAAAILKEQGKAKEAAELLDELKKRYPDATTK